MDRRILALGRALRDAGVPVSTPEILDAERAALAVGPARRDDLRAALGAALVKRVEHRGDFDAAFDRLFPAGIARPQRRRGPGAAPAGAGVPGAVAGGQSPGDGGGTAATPGAAASAASGRAETPAGGESGERGDEPADGELPEGKPRDAAGDATRERESDGAAAASARERDGGAPGERERERAEAARQDAAGRRRVLAKGFRERWSGGEEREALAAMEELTRRLATRVSRRRRRSPRGPVDVRGTLRANLAHGGVPFRLLRRRRAAGRRDLVLLADVSGSVRRAAALFLLILGRLRGGFAGVRAFAYVDRPAEIPASLAALPPARIAAALANVLPLDALSDHGEMLRRFNRDFAGAVGRRSVVVVLGDARNNRLPAQEWELEAIRRRAHRVIWIVPEPASLWGSADSAIAAYAPHCDAVIAAPSPAALAAAAGRIPGLLAGRRPSRRGRITVY
jgi:uncharacterized protein with von Willebrand factor type A (vWA) domain